MSWRSPVRPWASWAGQAKNGVPVQDLLKRSWLSGVLRYKLNPDQQGVYDAIYASHARATSSAQRWYVLDIGRQYGKDFISATIAIETVLRYAAKGEKVRFPYGAPTREEIKELIVPTFEKLFVDCPPQLLPKELQDGSFTRSATQLTFPSGGQIVLVGLDLHPDRMRGPASKAFALTEAAFVRDLDYVFHSVLLHQLQSHPDGFGILASTPSSPTHPWSKHFVPTAKIRGNYVHRTIDHNPMLSDAQKQGFYQELGGEHSERARRELRAEHIADPTLSVVPEMDDVKDSVIVGGTYPLPKYYHGYEALDPGMHHLCGGVFAAHSFEDGYLIILDGFAVAHKTTRTVSRLIKEREKSLWGVPWQPDGTLGRAWPEDAAQYYNGGKLVHQPYRRVSDTDLRMIADLDDEHQLKFEPTAKDNKEAAINAFRMRVAAGKVIFRGERCSVVAAHTQHATYVKAGKLDFAESGDFGHFDCLAALIYLDRNVVRTSNPFPPTYLGAGRQMHVPEHVRKLEQRKGAEQLFRGSYKQKRRERRRGLH